jgi:hypothetical protein
MAFPPEDPREAMRREDPAPSYGGVPTDYFAAFAFADKPSRMRSSATAEIFRRCLTASNRSSWASSGGRYRPTFSRTFLGVGGLARTDIRQP